MAYCSKCGKKIDKDDDFCRSCGAKQKKKKTNDLKLVAAKCPSCGSNIKVDKSKETTKCEYCDTEIIIDDAIEKYKIEISGEVEIKNLPKVDNLLINANKYFEDKDYRDALIKYDAVLDLDPNQHIAILRRGICKALLSNIYFCDFTSLISAFNRVIQFDLKVEEKNAYVDDMISAIIFINDTVVANYNNLKRITTDDISVYLNTLQSCVNSFESVIPYITESKHLDKAYYYIIFDLIEIIYPRSYASGNYNKYGQEWYYSYSLNKDFLIEKRELTKKYIDVYKKFNSVACVEFETKFDALIKSDRNNLIMILVCLIFFAIIVISIIWG